MVPLFSRGFQMKTSLFALVAAAFLAFTPAANAADATDAPGLDGMYTTQKTITFSPGGEIFKFIEVFNKDRMMHVRYRIDGMCISACTFMLGLIPRQDICTTERGVFGFHSASIDLGIMSAHSPEATRLMAQIFPKDVKTVLKEKGFDPDSGEPHPELLYIPAETFVKVCHD
jgi:hypothetical protein